MKELLPKCVLSKNPAYNLSLDFYLKNNLLLIKIKTMFGHFTNSFFSKFY